MHNNAATCIYVYKLRLKVNSFTTKYREAKLMYTKSHVLSSFPGPLSSNRHFNGYKGQKIDIPLQGGEPGDVLEARNVPVIK